MSTELEDKARRAGITLSGSVIAVPAHQRDVLAERLLGAGHWVHADVIEGRYLGQQGVRREDIPRFAALAGPKLDVHLMVDRLTEAIDELPSGLGRITLQFPASGGIDAAMGQARSKAGSVWIALDNPPAHDLQKALKCGPDGLLVMLTPPGMPGHSADLQRLRHVQQPLLPLPPLGVDGGVNAENFDLLRDAGIVYAVAGRGLAGGTCAADPRNYQTARKVTP